MMASFPLPLRLRMKTGPLLSHLYLFLRSPVEGTPLAWWAARLGEPWYLLGILLMILALLALEYAAVYACGRDRL